MCSIAEKYPNTSLIAPETSSITYCSSPANSSTRIITRLMIAAMIWFFVKTDAKQPTEI